MIMRVAGTIVGAALGVWLIGSYDTAPVIVLTALFLENIRDAMVGLPRHGQSLPEHKVIWDHRPTIDWFWVKNGIKGGLATVIAIVLIQSYHPPGPAAIPLVAWIMTIFSHPFLRAGGFGDLGLFQRVFWASLLFVAVVVLLLLVTPYLADYAAICAALFAILLALGFCTARTAGFGFWAFLTILGVSTFVSLNPQVPVASITIINSFLGLWTGLLISALVGRLIWPVLPQEVFRDDLLKILPVPESVAQSRSAYGKDPDTVGHSSGRSGTGIASDSNPGFFGSRKSEGGPTDQDFPSFGHAVYGVGL